MPLTSRDVDFLRASVDAGVVARSRAYVRAVRLVSAHAMHVDAVVRGTHEYEVSLGVEGNQLVAFCTGPFFDDRFEPCKHVWAVVEAAVPKRQLGALADVARHRSIAGWPDDGLDTIHDPDADEDIEPVGRVPFDPRAGWGRTRPARRSPAGSRGRPRAA